MRAAKYEPMEDRLFSRRTITPEGHWLWKGHIDNHGYGRIRFNGKWDYVHRVSAILFLGYNPHHHEKVQINHKKECQIRHCFNPEHIYLGSHSENMEDMWSWGERMKVS